MTSPSLRNRRILVVEDEYFLADEIQCDLESSGAVVIGPVAGLSQALAIIEASRDLDGAILDVNLMGEKVFPAAEVLQERNVPILFVSGYDNIVIPQNFENVPRLQKPAPMQQVIAKLLAVMQRD